MFTWALHQPSLLIRFCTRWHCALVSRQPPGWAHRFWSLINTVAFLARHRPITQPLGARSGSQSDFAKASPCDSFRVGKGHRRWHHAVWATRQTFPMSIHSLNARQWSLRGVQGQGKQRARGSVRSQVLDGTRVRRASSRMKCNQYVCWPAEKLTVVGTKIVALPPPIKCIVLKVLFFLGSASCYTK